MVIALLDVMKRADEKQKIDEDISSISDADLEKYIRKLMGKMGIKGDGKKPRLSRCRRSRSMPAAQQRCRTSPRRRPSASYARSGRVRPPRHRGPASLRTTSRAAGLPRIQARCPRSPWVKSQRQNACRRGRGGPRRLRLRPLQKVSEGEWPALLRGRGPGAHWRDHVPQAVYAWCYEDDPGRDYRQLARLHRPAYPLDMHATRKCGWRHR